MSRSSKLTDSKVRLLITTGDADGIGWEVTTKALRPHPSTQFIVYRQAAKRSRPALNSAFKVRKAHSLAEALSTPFHVKTVIEIHSPTSPAHWVEEAAQACLKHQADGMVTAPLSKTTIIDAGLRDIGHTEILSRVSGVHDLFMGFVGQKFSVVLATGHSSLIDALAGLSGPKLSAALEAARQLRLLLPKARQTRPLALVGINPHAGENGLIGGEESWMRSLVTSDVRGPLVPDSAFLPKNWPLYSVYVCPYHDQGLIPFKLVHGFKAGVHLTLGLPFVRTSVDHGTAKDLFGRNLAEPGSMRDAIQMAIRLVKAQTLKENRS